MTVLGGRTGGASPRRRDRRRVAQRVAVPPDVQEAATEAAIIGALPSVTAIALRGAWSWTGYMFGFRADESGGGYATFLLHPADQ